MALTKLTPLLPTPKPSGSRGTVRKPTGSGVKVAFQAPLLPTPVKVPAPTNRPLNY